MKNFHMIAASLLFSVLLSSNVYAQMDEREPGIYAVWEEESVPLTYSNGRTGVVTTGVLGVEVGEQKCVYNNPTSGVVATGTFVMVINPDKKVVSRTMKAYNPFIKTMTPGNILILPLVVDKEKRVYEQGRTLAGINVSVKDRMDFEWEQISDNSFEIRMQNPVPGEYGIVFRASRLADYDYSAIFGFTIPE